MYIKKIVCTVQEEKREAFDQAQRQWAPLSQVSGFLGQVGGWNGDDAVIIAFWESKEAYKSFMEDVHDQIFNHNRQKNTYNSISVTLCKTNKIYTQLREALLETNTISMNKTDQRLFTMIASDEHSEEVIYLAFHPNEKGDIRLYHPWTVLPNE
ncbi:YdbC family protein [Pontibacillus marinus]|uniref:DUF4937 domain-containing protein n=1 Tax=Pontibacillus marinus BH030004 = DSM 16465 TaxID=1385511 RepID=A0A0A5FVW5_9BACI|nr:YdbC family protein [Pontibacillus marinus]KGX84936.1 hypothetical protein N783_15620 [Pontibacillus marinus BH030004 = DSM 16465]